MSAIVTDNTPSAFSTDAIAHLYPFDEIDGWRLLLSHFDLVEDSFSFILVLAPDDWGIALMREHLSKTLSPDPGALARVRFDPDGPPQNLAESLLALDPSPDLRVVWIDADPAEPDKLDDRDRCWEQALAILNRYRNALQKRWHCTLALAVPSRIEPVLRGAAPDLWSIRSGVFRIEPPGTARAAIDRLPLVERRLLDETDDAVSGDPAETLAQAEKLRGKPGRELLLATLLQRAGNQARARLDWATAERSLTEAYDLQAAAGGDAELRWEIAIDLARLFWETAKFDRAEHYLRLGLQIAQEHFGASDPKTATTLSDLAGSLKETNRLSEAESLMRRALAISERAYDPGHPAVAIGLNNLAQLLKTTNRLSEAEPLMRRALAISERAYGPDHPAVAIDLNNLAQLLQDTNRVSEAEPLMRRALSIAERLFGPDHPEVAIGLNNLARLLQDTNRVSEAEPLMRRAFAISERSFGPNHPTVAIRLNNLARLLQETDHLSEAEPLMRRALAIAERSFGPDHPTVAIRLNNLAGLLKATNRLSEAEPLIRRALAILTTFRRQTGHEHPRFQRAADNYADLLQAMGRTKSQVAAALKELTGGAKRPPGGSRARKRR